MLNLYPQKTFLKSKLQSLFSPGCGIADSLINILPVPNNNPKIITIQGNMPHYDKLFIDESSNMVYHIAGYGLSFNEGVTRLIGETVERYSLLTAKYKYQDKLIHTSYNDLIRKYSKVVPIDYLNLLSKESQTRMLQNTQRNAYPHFSVEHEIDWIELPSISNPSETVWIPSSLVYMGSNSALPTMSTGTATHISLKKAFINAVIEILQIHTFIKFWYGSIPCHRIDIENASINNTINKVFDSTESPEVIILDITDDILQIPTFVCICKNKHKQAPYISLGIQSGYDIEEAILRSIMESSAIYNSLGYMHITQESHFDHLTRESVDTAINLDDNFYYWANTNEIELKDSIINRLQTGRSYPIEVIKNKYQSFNNIDEEIKELANTLSKVSSYACFSDITDCNTKQYGYYTVRVVAPECLSMCFGSYPFDNHPAIKDELGGIKNGYFPHPLP